MKNLINQKTLQMSKITIKALKNLGFVATKNQPEVIYYKGNYGLKRELGNWLTVANHGGNWRTTLLAIETIPELEKDYLESTGEKLSP